MKLDIMFIFILAILSPFCRQSYFSVCFTHDKITLQFTHALCTFVSYCCYLVICDKFFIMKEEFEDTKGAIRICISKKKTTQGPKEKVQKDKQRSTKHTYKTKDRVTQTPLITGGELRCSGRVSSSCSTSDTCQLVIVYIFLYKCTIIDKCALPCTISMLLVNLGSTVNSVPNLE